MLWHFYVRFDRQFAYCNQTRGRGVKSLKHFLVGSPIRTERLAHERLTKKTALAVFSSDALSSTAYATEEILLVLAAAYVAPNSQADAFSRVIPISIGIATL